MTTLVERLGKESKSGKGISEELFLSEMKKVYSLILTSFEKQSQLLATIGNEAKAREDKVISLLSANERLLITLQKGFLQCNSGNEPNERKESLSSNQGNVTSGKPEGNGVNKPFSMITFNVNVFKESYIYRLPENLEQAVNEFIKQLNTPCTTIEVFQTMFEIWIKANPNYDIRKIVPGIGKKAFWQAMQKAISFNTAKPVKHTLTSNEDKSKDNTDMVSLLSILQAENISKDKLLEVLKTVKPHITKDDFDKQGNIDNSLFVEIKTMLGFNTSLAERYNKARIYISRLLAN